MAKKTEDYLKEGMIPPREYIRKRVDFVDYADMFNPEELPPRSVEILAKRWRYPMDDEELPIEERYKSARLMAYSQYLTLQKLQKEYDKSRKEKASKDVLVRRYGDCFHQLLKCIGMECEKLRLYGLKLEKRNDDVIVIVKYLVKHPEETKEIADMLRSHGYDEDD